MMTSLSATAKWRQYTVLLNLYGLIREIINKSPAIATCFISNLSQWAHFAPIIDGEIFHVAYHFKIWQHARRHELLMREYWSINYRLWDDIYRGEIAKARNAIRRLSSNFASYSSNAQGASWRRLHIHHELISCSHVAATLLIIIKCLV